MRAPLPAAPSAALASAGGPHTFYPDPGALWIAAAAIPLILLARLLAVSVPIGLLRLRRDFTAGAIPVMTWGGLRGGISVALVLSLPESEFKPLLVTATYCMVVFSIIVQGLTFESVILRFVRR